MQFNAEVTVPAPLERVFAFFSDAANLERLTPPWVNFHIVTPTPIAMRVGTLIDYTLRIRGIPVKWQSEITAWDPPHCFVDEQRRGPYRTWIHTHRFRAEGTSTVVSDSVTFEVPFGFLVGAFVRRDVQRIFAHRTRTLTQIFGMPCPQ